MVHFIVFRNATDRGGIGVIVEQSPPEEKGDNQRLSISVTNSSDTAYLFQPQVMTQRHARMTHLHLCRARDTE